VLCDQSIAVVVPAFNEADYIEACVAGIPAYVDRVLVVDDASTDDTAERTSRCPDPRLRLVRRRANGGVGAAILTGYRAAMSEGLDIAVVMAGDGQMHPDDLPGLLLPLLRGEADYVKGNRLAWPGASRVIPRSRLFGIRVLAAMTRLSSGYKGLQDCQCGYTALRLDVLRRVDLATVYPRYGFPNDLLNHLALVGATVVERVVRPIYEGQRSDLRIRRVVLPIAALLARGTLRRWRAKRQRREAEPLPMPPAIQPAVVGLSLEMPSGGPTERGR
jgi:glycosyltransferase involved in cell wall biosynthesis